MNTTNKQKLELNGIGTNWSNIKSYLFSKI